VDVDILRVVIIGVNSYPGALSALGLLFKASSSVSVSFDRGIKYINRDCPVMYPLVTNIRTALATSSTFPSLRSVSDRERSQPSQRNRMTNSSDRFV
jgi:hypothetical protein